MATREAIRYTCRPAWLSGNCLGGFGALNSSPPEYLLPSQWVPVLAPTYLLPRRSEWCSHCTKVWHKTYPICDATSRSVISVRNTKKPPRSARRGFAPSQKSRRNHCSCVWTEALPGMTLVAAQKLSSLVWTSLLHSRFRVVTQRSSPLGKSVAWRH